MFRRCCVPCLFSHLSGSTWYQTNWLIGRSETGWQISGRGNYLLIRRRTPEIQVQPKHSLVNHDNRGAWNCTELVLWKRHLQAPSYMNEGSLVDLLETTCCRVGSQLSSNSTLKQVQWECILTRSSLVSDLKEHGTTWEISTTGGCRCICY